MSEYVHEADQLPFFLTVDTEGDNLWSKPQVISSYNTEKLERFQILCERYHVIPVYLTNYEAAINKGFQSFVKEHEQKLEIGFHLHAWNSPPIFPLTSDDHMHQPYLHEYSNVVIRKKIDYMYKLLCDTFEHEIVVHRGGRYSVSPYIFECLLDCGIKIDCSATPGLSWKSSKGAPNVKGGGKNFRNYSEEIHSITVGERAMLEVPISTLIRNKHLSNLDYRNPLRRIYRKLCGNPSAVFRSHRDNNKELFDIIEDKRKKKMHLQYIIHSSELVKGGSYLIQTAQQETQFYEGLESLFEKIRASGFISHSFGNYFNNYSRLTQIAI